MNFQYKIMSLPFNKDNSYKSQYFEMEGDTYMFVRCESTGSETIDCIDYFRKLRTNTLYHGKRLSIFNMMIEKNAKIVCRL